MTGVSITPQLMTALVRKLQASLAHSGEIDAWIGWVPAVQTRSAFAQCFHRTPPGDGWIYLARYSQPCAASDMRDDILSIVSVSHQTQGKPPKVRRIKVRHPEYQLWLFPEISE